VIKAKPGDFVVEERTDLPLEPGGRYAVYRLHKSGWNTSDLVGHLARRFGFPPGRIAYGGKKDKHGLTSQFITIEDAADRSLEGKDFRLEAAGRMNRPMGPDLIRANDFTLTLRDLAGVASLEPAVERVRTEGFPNWFDDQRFRSYDPERGFFAEKILRRHWNGALQVFLTSVTPGLSGRERTRRRELFRVWRDWKACRSMAANPFERDVFDILRNDPAAFGEALHRIPEEETAMQYAVLQAHLWNETLRKIFRSRGDREGGPGRAPRPPHSHGRGENGFSRPGGGGAVRRRAGGKRLVPVRFPDEGAPAGPVSIVSPAGGRRPEKIHDS